jgi:8-oxo-dGTP pyrophosphatase MutT (NUDIX family)
MLLSQRTFSASVERVRRMLGGVPARIQVAALPWRGTDKGVEVMLITSRDTGRWVLPKGWPESGEMRWQAALREAGEEAGLVGTMSDQEIGRYFYGKNLKSGLEQRCEVHVFPLQVAKVESKWPEKGQRVRKWFSPQIGASRVHEPELAEILANFNPSA